MKPIENLDFDFFWGQRAKYKRMLTLDCFFSSLWKSDRLYPEDKIDPRPSA
jgi:hypothetical protein